ncbi:unnamed protein product [Arabidopsis lyrata]|nr:unnamed protein product [Arabidopsis lyrata]
MRSLWIHSLVASTPVKGFHDRRLHRREILRWVDPVFQSYIYNKQSKKFFFLQASFKD